MGGSADNLSDRPQYGYSVGNIVINAYHYYDGVTGSWKLNVDGQDRMVVDNIGYLGLGSGDTCYAVYGIANGGTANHGGYFEGSLYGIYASSGNWAGYFVNDVNIVGTLYKGSGSFRIDHPLDMANKYLQHSFVESPDMMNI